MRPDSRDRFISALEANLKYAPSIAQPFITLFIQSFKRKPRLTVFITLIIAVSLPLIGWNANKQDQRRQEQLRRYASYDVQLAELDKLQDSLKNLQDFVRTQKRALEDSQKTLDELRQQEQQLRPVVEADRKLVEAVLAFQRAEQRREMWKDRTIGFVLGFIASILASILYGMISNRLRSQRNPEIRAGTGPSRPQINP